MEGFRCKLEVTLPARETCVTAFDEKEAFKVGKQSCPTEQAMHLFAYRHLTA